MRVLVAMSGGVDSSVAAALLVEQGHEVVGATMKLWGGPSDTGCCSVADVEDARRVAQQVGIVHHVFNFSRDFEAAVVDPYVADHAAGRTPNPCVECNRHLKFDSFLRRARSLGFDAVATGHHARVRHEGGEWRLLRGTDRAKDQSYVLHMLTQAHLERVLLPVGELTKAQVRQKAAALGLRTAAKPDSQDVCFIGRRAGREEFLTGRIELHPGVLLTRDGTVLGSVPAVETVTVGQRRGLGVAPAGTPLYAVAVDVGSRTVTLGRAEDLLVDRVVLERVTWVGRALPPGSPVEVQASAHGPVATGVWQGGWVELDRPIRRVAAGQSVVFYRGEEVQGGGICSGTRRGRSDGSPAGP